MDFIIHVSKPVPGSTDLSVTTDGKSTDLAAKKAQDLLKNSKFLSVIEPRTECVHRCGLRAGGTGDQYTVCPGS